MLPVPVTFVILKATEYCRAIAGGHGLIAYLWYKAAHLIFIVTWFSGLFYLPRLFVYHADAKDTVSHKRFCIMEHKLYYYITWPSAILTTVFGLLLIEFINPVMTYFRVKLLLVFILWGYHISLGYFLM